MARLDRLASVRWVAQIGAAIGREFSHPLVRAVSGLPENELQDSIARLVASELVFQRGMPPEAVYSFKHALVQEPLTAACCEVLGNSCTRKSPKRSKLIPRAGGESARAARAAL